MTVRIHPHAQGRMELRGASADEVEITVAKGEQFPAKHGRTGFRRNFAGAWTWRGRTFDTKQIEAYAVVEDGSWLVITVIVKFF
jgi:hypothetical protein